MPERAIAECRSGPGRGTASGRRLALVVGCLGVAALAAGAGFLMGRYGEGLPAAGEGGRAPAAGGRHVACSGYVDVDGGVASLAPLQSGRVKQVLVHEGASVGAGEILLHLEDGQYRDRVAEAEAALRTARARRSQARELDRQYPHKLGQQRAAVGAARHRQAAAQHIVSYKEHLHELKLLSATELAAAREQAEEAQSLEKGEEEKLAEMELHDPRLEVQSSESEVAVLEARLGQARRALQECDLKAPRAGTVLRVLAGCGDVVGGQPAVLFCPQEPRLVRAEVEQEFAGRVAVGQPALVEDDTDPTAVWPGKVMRVADWYAQRRPVKPDPAQFHDVRTVECLIALEAGPAPPPRIGQRVRVIIGRADTGPAQSGASAGP